MLARSFLDLSLAALFSNIAILSGNLLLDRKAERGRSSIVFVITKLLIMPLIALVWFQLTMDYDWRVIAYMLFAWIGDAGLLAKVDRTLMEWILGVIGVSGFLLSHIMIILYFDIRWGSIPAWAVLLLIPGLMLFARSVPKLKCSGFSGAFVLLYCFWLQGANAMSIAQLCSADYWRGSSLMCSIGYFFFLISDSFLIAKEFGADIEMRRFEVLSTYAIAQTLIILGCAFSSCE
jgi:hypothetical protein